MSDRTKREAWITSKMKSVPLPMDSTIWAHDLKMLHLYVDSLEETIESQDETIEQLEAELKELRHE